MKPHDQNLIAAVREFITAQKAVDATFTEAQFARLARVTHPALSSWLGGKYGANPAGIEAKFRDVLEGRANSNRLPDAKPLENTVTEEIAAALDIARGTDTIAVAHGRAGIGKSVALDLYVAQNPRTILIKLTPESASRTGLRRAIHRALGEPKGGKGDNVFEACVAKVKNAEQLFVFDDAHLLTRSGFAWLVGFHDSTRAGIALVGNPEVVATAQHLAQWHTRIAAIEEVDFPDVKKSNELSVAARHLLRHWLGTFPDAVKALDQSICEIAQKTRNLRDVVQVLRNVRHLMLKGVSPSDAITAAVASKRFPLTFEHVNALAAQPETLALLNGGKEAA